jgi:hypothetical protein
MNYYSFHIGDYRGATAHLSNEEDIAYRRLIDMYYDTEKAIPLETHWVSRRLRVTTEALEIVLSDFFILSEDGWHHTRCDESIVAYHRGVEKNRENGKKGGRPTHKNNPVGFQSLQVANPSETDRQGNQEPITNNHKPNIKTAREKTRTPTKSFLPNDFKVSERVEAWATEKGFSNLDRHLENFISACKAKGYQYVDFDEAFMSAIRNNWAKVEAKPSTANQAALVDIRWRGAK